MDERMSLYDTFSTMVGS